MSPGGFGAALLVVAWAVAVLGQEPIAGFAPSDVATVLAFAAVALMLTGWAAERTRGGWRATVGASFVWLVLLAGLGGAYLRRDEIYDTARAIGQDIGIGPPQATIGTGGEVAVTRRFDGTFGVPARVNGREVGFLFDTGASSVVLSAETAASLGFEAEKLRFRVPVTTANGRGVAAPVVLDTLAVGTIEMRRVPALVVRTGMLDGNLLGQTFLEKLESYEVRGNRLVLRAGKP